MLKAPNCSGKKSVCLKVVCLRKNVKSSSLHRPKGMQDPCKTHHFSPPFILPHCTFFSCLCPTPHAPVQGILFHPFFTLSFYLHLSWKSFWARTFARSELMFAYVLGKKIPSEPLWACAFTSLFLFLLALPLCLSCLFVLVRLPRLAERRLDIYLSLTFLE